MSHHNNMSLEELEARCDTLQRRVQERSSQPMRSPPRPAGNSSPVRSSGYGSRGGSPSVSRNLPVSPPRVNHHHAPTSTSSSTLNGSSIHNVVPPMQLQQQQQNVLLTPQSHNVMHTPMPTAAAGIEATNATTASGGLTPSEVATAVSNLEAERTRLESQLRQINMHLRAYQQLQQLQIAAVAPSAPKQLQNPYTTPSPAMHHTSVASAARPSSPPRVPPMSTPPAPAPTHSSPTRHRSPPRPTTPGTTTSMHSQQQNASVLTTPSVSAISGGNGNGTAAVSTPRGGGGTSAQTEEIYKELQAIRKAREEREAQRRAALQAAATPQKLSA